MPETIAINPNLIRWAIDRSRLPREELDRTFPRLHDWEAGIREPTFRQLERFASKTMTPLGYFFLDAPPEEQIPIPDFRTMGDRPVERPSPNLIETIQAMQRRQAWMREFRIEEGHEMLAFVASSRNARNVVSLAARMRESLGLDVDWATRHATWEDALRTLRTAAERIGILVATSSVVGLNNHRPLDPQEFRGFVLCDEYAPLIFVNGGDAKSAQMFTLAHELAHVWVGQDGVFNLIGTLPHRDETEQFCNRSAAEFLIPAQRLKDRWREAKATSNPYKTVASWFKVSPIVAARRALDLDLITRPQFFSFYEKEQQEWRARKEREKKKPGGPSFYDVQDVRLGRSFAYSVVRAVREGRLPYREAYTLTDLKGDTFNSYASRLIEKMKEERG